MTQRIIHQWKTLQLIEKEIRLPNQKTITHTQLLHPGAAVILPVLDTGEIIILKQFRPAIDKWLYELPAGTMEHGEDPLTCAKRELIEESGFAASSWQAMGACTPMAGFCDEIQYLFLAKDITPCDQYTCDDDEVIYVERMTLSQIEQMICMDKITDAKTIACISKAKLLGYLI